jgi:thioredoxin 1
MSATIKIVIVVAVLTAAVGLIAMKQKTPKAPPDSASAVTTPVDALPQQTSAPLPRLVDLGAGKCIPCKMMMPILDQLRHDFGDHFEVTFIDISIDREAGEVYGVHIIPTQIFFDADGNELFRHEGFYAREEILDKWRELGFVFEPATASEAAS